MIEELRDREWFRSLPSLREELRRLPLNGTRVAAHSAGKSRRRIVAIPA